MAGNTPVRGIRQPFPPRTVLARLENTTGAPSAVPIAELVKATVSSPGGGGTVTSVAVSGANGIAVASSPITTAGTIALSITANGILNASLAQMATKTLKGNKTGSTANAADLTVSEVLTMLGAFAETIGSWTPADNSGAGLTFTSISAKYTQHGKCGGSDRLASPCHARSLR